jgi:hypothetical protein
MTARLTTLCLLLLAAAFAAHADDGTPKDHPGIATIVKGGGCAPKDNMARVLKSANPLDNAPNWTGKLMSAPAGPSCRNATWSPNSPAAFSWKAI